MHKPRKSPKALSMTLNSTKFSHSNAPTHYLEKILQKKINKQKNTKSYTIFTKTPVTPPYIKGLNPEKDRTNLDAFTSQTGEAEVTTCLSQALEDLERKPSPRLLGQSCSLQGSCKPSTQQLCRAGTRQSSTCSLLPPLETQLRKPQSWPLGLLPAPQHRN